MILSKKSVYAMKFKTFFAGIDSVQKDLAYLEDFLNNPYKKFKIKNITDFCLAVTALSTQLDYMTGKLSRNKVSDDGELLYLSEEQLTSLSFYSDLATSSVEKIRESCGIDLEIN